MNRPAAPCEKIGIGEAFGTGNCALASGSGVQPKQILWELEAGIGIEPIFTDLQSAA